MEISEATLRQLVRDVDEQHREGLAALPGQVAELHLGEGRRVLASGRRAFLRRAAAGVTVGIGTAVLPISRLMSPAAAQEGEELPPDDEIAAFAESIELVAVEAYQQAVSSGKVTTPALAAAAGTFAQHHREHATAFGAAGGAKALHTANATLLHVVSDQLRAAPDEKAAVKIAYDVENSTASTYMWALGILRQPDAAKLVASILPVEGQHAVVLGTAIGLPQEDVVPAFETQDGKFDPVTYPVSA
jgi:hypothetical protein